MRLVHTSDWHLGHTLHEISRRAEHLAFFDWLLGRLEALAADALLVAGDPFFISRFYQFIVLAARHAVPTIYPLREYVVPGGLKPA